MTSDLPEKVALAVVAYKKARLRFRQHLRAYGMTHRLTKRAYETVEIAACILADRIVKEIRRGEKKLGAKP